MASFISTRSCGASLASSVSSSCGSSFETTPFGCGCGRNGTCSGSAAPANNPDACTCCKQSLREALKLLCCNSVSDLVDFDAFAFITDTNIVGSTPATIGEAGHDNLGALAATFRRFSPCNCDLIDIVGTVYTPFGTTIEVDQGNLCALNAIVFQLLPAPTETTNETCCSTDTDLCRYRRVRDLLQNELQAMDQPCGECSTHCNCTDNCCCTAGIVTALSNATLNKRTTLSAGLLSLRDVTALGTIGSVLVLGNEDQNRFYFVCANKVDFLV